jgi:hypothetical protein
VPARAQAPAAPQSNVPHWDARGVGPPAWQGVACLDVNDDATRIALGTIAPAGEPNVLLLGADGPGAQGGQDQGDCPGRGDAATGHE